MRVLMIDLEAEKAEIRNRDQLFEKYIGGDGVAIKLLIENCPKGVDSLSPENPIILATGPLTTAFPVITKTVAMFKSPLNGELGESYAGGRLGAAMRFADYGAIVIKGRAENPTVLLIHNDEVIFKDARAAWGISSAYVLGKMLRRKEPFPGRRSIIRIGIGGENLVRFANVNVDSYRHFGRLGLGAVFGSKNLLALAISGTKSLSMPDIREYRRAYWEIREVVDKTDLLKKYHDLGTAMNVMPLNYLKGLPTRNLKEAYFEFAENISGETLAANFLSKRWACTGCPVACIHIARVQIPFAKGFEFESRSIPYDYEHLYALGSLLGIQLAEDVLRLIEAVDNYGLDVISSGTALSWATEAYENHLISKRDTMGIELAWGDVEAYVGAIAHIAKRSNDFFRTLGDGVHAAAEKYGGEDFALNLGGLSIAGYHTGKANLLGHIGAPRHGHLDTAGYSLDQKHLKRPMSPEKMVDEIYSEITWRCFTNTLVMCLFARGVYTEERLKKALDSVGVFKKPEEYREIGEEIFRLKYEFKVREGFNLEDVKIPRGSMKRKAPRVS
jgi:aldehyde:ferredoxin oxidoreductase